MKKEEKKSNIFIKVIRYPIVKIGTILSLIPVVLKLLPLKFLQAFGAVIILPIMELIVGNNAEPYIKKYFPELLPSTNTTRPYSPTIGIRGNKETPLNTFLAIAKGGSISITRDNQTSQLSYDYKYDDFSGAEKKILIFSNRSLKGSKNSESISKKDYAFCLGNKPYSVSIVNANDKTLKFTLRKINKNKSYCL